MSSAALINHLQANFQNRASPESPPSATQKNTKKAIQMEVLGSNLGTRIAVPKPRALRSRFDYRVPPFIPSYQRQHLGKVNLAEKLVLQNMGNGPRGFECRNSVQEAEGVLERKGGQNSEREIRRKRLAVFVSGGGSNFRLIHEATVGGSVHGDVVVLVTDKPGCGGAAYARNSDIPVILFPKTKSSPEGLSSVDLVTTLRNFNVDFILLAGYLKLIPAELVQAYPRSMLNIHPSLLPAFGGKGFYGLKVHQAVIASGARYSGPTVHFVDENFDTGRILAQRVVPVLADDTAERLAARVLHEEHGVYVEVVSALCEERIFWREDGVPLLRSRDNPDEYS